MKNLIKYLLLIFIYIFLYCSSYQETENINLQQVNTTKQKEIESNQEKIQEIHTNESEKKETRQEDQNNQHLAIPEENQKDDLSEIPKTENITQTQEEKTKTQEIADSKEKEKIDIQKMIQEDRKLIETIKDNIEQFTESSEDTTVLKNKKQKQFTQKLKEINKKYLGKTLTFQYLYLENVKPEQELTPYGKQQIKKFIQEVKKDPQGKSILIFGEDIKKNPFLQLALASYLLMCNKCYRETGRYELELYLANNPDNEFDKKDSTNKIIFIIPNESKALEYKKGQFYPISGKVEFINIEKTIYGLETTIYLK